MGFVSQIAAKVTGADVQADIAKRQADEQAAATRAAAETAAAAGREVRLCRCRCSSIRSGCRLLAQLGIRNDPFSGFAAKSKWR